MPVIQTVDGTPLWRRRTTRQELLRWFGWLCLVALFVFCWQVMTKDTIWAFVLDAPTQAADIGSRMVPPRWSYLNELWRPLWDTLAIATLGTLLGDHSRGADCVSRRPQYHAERMAGATGQPCSSSCRRVRSIR